MRIMVYNYNVDCMDYMRMATNRSSGMFLLLEDPMIFYSPLKGQKGQAGAFSTALFCLIMKRELFLRRKRRVDNSWNFSFS